MGFRTLCPKTKNTRGGGRGILLISQTSSLCLGDSVAIPSVVSFDPVNILLNEVECRVLGSLIEKEITTPEYYPLTLNALVNACNQLSNRDPVVSFDEKTVARALESLREKRLAWMVTGIGRVPKYEQRFAEEYKLAEQELAVLCVLMPRGPQTVGEIRGRTGRLYEFKELEEVELTLQALMTVQPPFAVKLP